MRKPLILALGLLLGACQSRVNSPELNQCAQQNFQCESSCQQQNGPDCFGNDVCINKCIEQFNRCKEQAKQLDGSGTP